MIFGLSVRPLNLDCPMGFDIVVNCLWLRCFYRVLCVVQAFGAAVVVCQESLLGCPCGTRVRMLPV
jgi:pantothenate kinase type III